MKIASLLSVLSFVIVGLAHADDDFSRKYVLRTLTYALELQTKCSSWKMKDSMFADLLAEGKVDPKDVLPGGKFSELYVEYAGYAAQELKNLNGERACRVAEFDFGPNGNIAQNFMTRVR